MASWPGTVIVGVSVLCFQLGAGSLWLRLWTGFVVKRCGWLSWCTGALHRGVGLPSPGSH
ncbi:hypothetical protein [Halomicronema hongdechloris]|uniref:hypothetical protein n=1 Tax=Halomicronema hongdechloris TaxID=1209493 RepID=UPI0010CC3AC1|nr:hypothetical protein [Halomicronema hongdechloris]